ncbi:MAG TPA: methyl-accepting chemotaxis protein [Methylomirabilota bacterium]|jgi:twitching motility protein PilJ|nr:methyl-accepting chemotaxis protein [Methylomirabilota bacterium]
MAQARTRFGLLPKIIVFLAVVLIPLAAVTWYVSVRTLRERMTDEFTSKGTAIANSLASSGVDLILNRDASTVQALIDQFVSIGGVAYVMVYDPQKTLIAHTFHPIVPPDLIDKNLVPGETSKQVREIHYTDPVTGAPRSIIDVGVPMLAGQVGTVRVGMNKAIIDGAAGQSGWFLFAVFGGVAFLAVAAGAVFARRLTRPIGDIVRAAEQVGRGDLTHTVKVRSRDEIGQLARTFNDTVTRLRSQVLTEAERDEEKKRREDLQKNIATFLETVTQISQGDLRKRGDVTPDILGNVVDAVNLMVEEIGALLADVRHAALRVSASAGDMLSATDQMASGAEKQAREATVVSREVETMSRSVQLVASNAASAATAAGQTLEAATRGETSVRDSLAGMQRIRGEVQVISKRIKSLGDRSLEISEIVDTIEEIASHTNLLALNAAIEAAGAGESGVRFAVVADEIRKLAERAAKATKDIAARIRAVQAETQEAVVAMEEGTREVEAGYAVTIRAEESLKSIAGISKTSAELAEEISTSSQQQVRGADGVVRAMRSIADVAVHTEQAVLQTRRTVDDLVKLADELTRSLARFKLAAV